MKNALNWFEILAINVERAARSYGTILDILLEVREATPGFRMAMLPAEEDGVGGALVQGEGYAWSNCWKSLRSLDAATIDRI